MPFVCLVDLFIIRHPERSWVPVCATYAIVTVPSPGSLLFLRPGVLLIDVRYSRTAVSGEGNMLPDVDPQRHKLPVPYHKEQR